MDREEILAARERLSALKDKRRASRSDLHRGRRARDRLAPRADTGAARGLRQRRALPRMTPSIRTTSRLPRGWCWRRARWCFRRSRRRNNRSSRRSSHRRNPPMTTRPTRTIPKSTAPSMKSSLPRSRPRFRPMCLRRCAMSSTRSRGRSQGKAGALQKSNKRGRPAGVLRGDLRAGARLNVIETLRAAAPWQPLRRREAAASGETSRPRILIRKDDFRISRFKQRTETTTIFVVDASGSAALHRLAEAKGAVELLLADCYIRRDQVALIAFRGSAAELLLPPTRSLARAKRSLAGLPGGGGTPLAAGLDAAFALSDSIRRKGQTPTVDRLDRRARQYRARRRAGASTCRGRCDATPHGNCVRPVSPPCWSIRRPGLVLQEKPSPGKWARAICRCRMPTLRRYRKRCWRATR